MEDNNVETEEVTSEAAEITSPEVREPEVTAAPADAQAAVSDTKNSETAETPKEEVKATKVPRRHSTSEKLEWFVVHAYSGFEQKVKQGLEERIRINNMEDLFGEIHVPEEKVVEIVKGSKKTSNRKFFPGYIVVQMVMNEDSWHLVDQTPKVTGFVGDRLAPVPLMPEEVERLLSQIKDGSSGSKAKTVFTQGEVVKVISGPFAEFTATVEDVKAEKEKLTVLISIFGRATPVELDFFQVERVQG